MSMIRKNAQVQVEQSADNRTRVIASTNQLARDGHIVEPAGLQVQNFLRTAAILFDHDPKSPVAAPVAASISPDGSSLSVEVEWPPPGVDAQADRIRGLVKAGIIRSVSIGFEPLDAEPLDPKKPRGGMHVSRAELLEMSFVSVPADTGAVVTQRSAEDWKCGASRDLPIEDSDEWDGSAAEESIFEWAGGDDFDPSKARKGFLAYNAAKPKERGSYKLPIAHVVGGRMKVPKGAIRAAASRLPNTDIPEDVKDSARTVIDHYEEKAGMSGKAKTEEGRALQVKHQRALRSAPKVLVIQRGLCHVAELAWLLHQLGYCHESAEYEAALEEDDSPVPAMIGEALKQLGESLVAMTQEEVAELLAAATGEDEDDEGDAPDDERSFIAGGKTKLARAWRRGIAWVRAGRTLSAANGKHLERALKHHERAMKHHKELGSNHEEIGKAVEQSQSAQDKATAAHGELGETLQAVKNEPEKATEHVARAVQLHKQLGKHHEAIAEANDDLDEAQQNAVDSHEAQQRCMAGIKRSVKAVVDGSQAGAEDGDSKLVQTSESIEESSGSEGGRSVDFRRRQADLLRLSCG